MRRFVYVSYLLDLYAHASSGAFNDFHCGLDIVRGKVYHLLLGDFLDLRLSDGTCLRRKILTGAFILPDFLQDETTCWRGLRDEVEAAVLVDRDLDRNDGATLSLRLRVERLAEVHDVDPVLTEGGADRRRRVGLAGRNLELDEGHYFFSHGTECLKGLGG